MAMVKVYEDNLNQQHTKVSKDISEIENDLANIEKYKLLITDRWQSNAAIGYVNNIESEKNELNKAIKDVKELQKYVKTTTNKVLEADRQIKKKFSSIIEG